MAERELRVFTYRYGPEAPLPGFEECTAAETAFREQIERFYQASSLDNADIAFIPVRAASLFYSFGCDQRKFEKYVTENYLNHIAPRHTRRKIPHFLIFSYVLVGVDFSFIPSDIKILAYESEVTELNSAQLRDNGCGDRVITIPYILGDQPFFSRHVSAVFSGAEVEKAEDFCRRRDICFVGSRNSERTSDLIRRNLLLDSLCSKIQIDSADPLKEDVLLPYRRSKLGLILRGDTPTRRAFYSCISQGAIPVIFDREIIHYGELFNGSLNIEASLIIVPYREKFCEKYLDHITKIIQSALADVSALYQKHTEICSIFDFLNYNRLNVDGVSTPVKLALNSVIGTLNRSTKKPPFIFRYNQNQRPRIPVKIAPTEVLDVETFENYGFGKRFGNLFGTSQYSLEVIWENKVENYPYLTSCYDKADFAFIPLQTFLFAWQSKPYFYNVDDVVTVVEEILREFKVSEKSDKTHLLVYSDVLWPDDRVFLNRTKLPENLVTICLEGPGESHESKQESILAVPYATEVHNDDFWSEINELEAQRDLLLAYIGRARPEVEILINSRPPIHDFYFDLLRDTIDDAYWKSINNINITERILSIYNKSRFSLHPHGDRKTRRGFYHSIICGSIPVLFANNFKGYEDAIKSVVSQIEISDICVVIPEGSDRDILSVIKSIGQKREMELRKNIYRLRRKIIYSEWSESGDAFYSAIFNLAARKNKLRDRVFRPDKKFSFLESVAGYFIRVIKSIK